MPIPSAPVGKCRICGCTEARRCRLYTGSGDECGWFNKRQDLCTNDKCILAADRKRKEADAARRREKQQGPFKVIRRNPQTNRATRIVRRRERKSA